MDYNYLMFYRFLTDGTSTLDGLQVISIRSSLLYLLSFRLRLNTFFVYFSIYLLSPRCIVVLHLATVADAPSISDIRVLVSSN